MKNAVNSVIIFLPLLIVIALGVPLFSLYWTIRLGVTTLRWLALLNRHHISPVGRRVHVAVLIPGLGYQAPHHHFHGSQGPTSLDPPAHWEGSHHEFDW